MPRSYPVPGGHATFKLKKDRTRGNTRRITLALVNLPDELITAAAVTDGKQTEGDPTAAPIKVTSEVITASWDLSNTLILELLSGWTVPNAAGDGIRALPQTADDLDELPDPLFVRLQEIAAKLQAEAGADGDGTEFSAENVQNQDSPTGA